MADFSMTFKKQGKIGSSVQRLVLPSTGLQKSTKRFGSVDMKYCGTVLL